MINGTLIHNHIDELFGHDMHAKRVTSLANAAHGVIEKGSLAIHAIGAGLAQANKLKRKSAIKVDRLLSNTKLNVCVIKGSRFELIALIFLLVRYLNLNEPLTF